MAKKTSAPALEFEFKASTLQAILSNNPDKVVFTVSVEAASVKGKPAGVLRINAKGMRGGRTIVTRDGGSGVPKPPGIGI